MEKQSKIEKLHKSLQTIKKGSDPKPQSLQTYALTFFDNDMKNTEMDIFLYLINQIETGVGNTYYSIADYIVTLPVSKIWERDSFNYTRLRRACINLRKQGIVVDDPEEGKGITANLFSSVMWDSRKGLIHVEINRKMQPIFMELKQGYSQYLFSETRMFNDASSKKLYVMMGAYYKKEHNRFKIGINELSSKLGLKYRNRYNQFINEVIEPAIKKINDNSQIMRVEYNYGKDSYGKWVIEFIPSVLKCEDGNTLPEILPYDEKQTRCYNILIDLGVSNNIAHNIVQKQMMEFWKWYYHNKDRFFIEGKRGIHNPGAVIVKHFGYAKK